MEKCKYADEYKAIYPPRCGCNVCERKWQDAEDERRRKKQQEEDDDFYLMLAAIAGL